MVRDIGVLGFVVGGQNKVYSYGLQYAEITDLIKSYRHIAGANFTLIGHTNLPDPVLGRWYDMRVDVVGTTFSVYVDGLLKLTANDTAYVSADKDQGLLGYEGSRNEYDDVIVTPDVPGLSGIYSLNVFDAGAPMNWGSLLWWADLPAGTVLAFSVRTGDPPLPDNTWTAFKTISHSGDAIGGNSQYIQYRVTLATTNERISPALKQVRIIYSSD